MQVELEVEALRRTFLDEIGVPHALLNGCDEAQAVLGGAGRQALFLQRRPGVGDAFAQGCLGARGRVPGDDVEAVGQGAGDPAAANDAAAESGEGLDLGDEGHRGLLVL
ncbi:hypothetical protein D9M71_363550 [compost metagenome]